MGGRRDGCGEARCPELAFALRSAYSPNFALVLEKLNSSPPKTLHSVVILFLVLSLFASLLSSGFTFYNSLSNPYQTFLGPVGVYTWSGLGGEYGPCVSLTRTNTVTAEPQGQAGSLCAASRSRGWGSGLQTYSIA